VHGDIVITLFREEFQRGLEYLSALPQISSFPTGKILVRFVDLTKL
jgi:hypothetical protein